jgi:hypothetical protein
MEIQRLTTEITARRSRNQKECGSLLRRFLTPAGQQAAQATDISGSKLPHSKVAKIYAPREAFETVSALLRSDTAQHPSAAPIQEL